MSIQEKFKGTSYSVSFHGFKRKRDVYKCKHFVKKTYWFFTVVKYKFIIHDVFSSLLMKTKGDV